MTKTTRVADLIGLPENAIQYCRECGGEFSANYNDYFTLTDDTKLTHCGKPVALVVKRVDFVEVSR